MSARPTKRPRTRSVARRERKEAPALASVLLPLVQEGFLGHQELGRLSQTSRQLRTQCKDELWKTLCSYRWPNSPRLKHALFIREGGYSGWYRRRISTIPEHPIGEPPPLDPPSLKVEDVCIFVDITRGGHSLLSLRFVGTHVQSLLDEGWIPLFLRNPVPLGQAACFLKGACSCDARCRFNLIEDDFDVNLQLYRRNETSCRIYQSMKHDPEYIFPGNGSVVRFPIDTCSRQWKESKCIEIDLGPGVPNEELGLALRWTPMAAEIHRRLQGSISFGVTIFIEIVEQQAEKVVAITGFQINTFKEPTGVAFKSKKEAEKHGVTLLHILQELQSVEL